MPISSPLPKEERDMEVSYFTTMIGTNSK